MTNPGGPYSRKPQWSQPQPRRELQEKTREWKTFDALPPPPAELAYSKTETEAAVEAATDANLASLKRRAGAFALDFGLGLGASYALQGLTALFGGGAEAVSMAGYAAFFGSWLVNRGYFQSRPAGQSFGKWLLNIKTVDAQDEDESPTLLRSMARESVSSLLIATEALIVPLAADGLFSVFDKEKRQSLHDRAAGTKVVNCEEGYRLDEKFAEFLQDVEAGDALDTFKDSFGDIVDRAQQDDTVKDVRKNVQGLGRQASKQVRTWVENVQDKLDNL